MKAHRHARADSELALCIQRRGEALALLVDEEPTFGYFPSVYYFMGRAREGMGSGADGAYRDYLRIHGASTEDRLLPEIRRRAG